MADDYEIAPIGKIRPLSRLYAKGHQARRINQASTISELRLKAKLDAELAEPKVKFNDNYELAEGEVVDLSKLYEEQSTVATSKALNYNRNKTLLNNKRRNRYLKNLADIKIKTYKKVYGEIVD
jgi:phage antirepressor YoqD-like protein